jgi:hypothetical protein
MFTPQEYSDIKEIVNHTSWFDLHPYEGEDNDYSIMLTTRDNGSVYEEEPGDEDIEEAIRLCKVIQTKLGYEAEWDVTDEWVNIYVRKR